MTTAIAYSLHVAGQPASSAVVEAIQQIEVEDHAELADIARIKLAVAVAGPESAWTVLDDPVCERLTKVRLGVRLGTAGESVLIDGYVVDVRAQLAADPGRSSVEVVLLDGSALMDLEERVRAWPDQTDSTIATAIFADHGFSSDVQPTARSRQQREVTTMQRDTDIRFLRRLAERNGYECYLEVGDDGRTVGHFHAPRLEQPPQAVLSVNLGAATTLDGFSVRHDMLAATTAEVSGLDVADARPQDAAIKEASARSLGAASSVATDRPRVRLLSQTGLGTADELQTMAQAVVDRSSFAITAQGTVSAAVLPQVLRAKRPVTVRGAGERFSGEYYVERVLHRVAGTTYEQRLTLRRNAAGLTRRERFVDDGVASPAPAVVL